MKKCPYCDEEIQDDAIKCRSCGEMIKDSPQLLSSDSSAKSNGKPISKNKTFLIPIILVILLPLLTISFVYYERYYENNRYELEQKKDKTGDTLREKTTLKDHKDAKAYFNRGLAYDDKGQYDQAISDYSKAIEINSGIAEAYINRGNAYSKKSQYDKAISDYSKAIEINPKYADAYINRGIAHNSLGNYNSACDDWLKACKLGNCDGLNWAKQEGVCQ
jgi:tetratricopeptide (TPR) repeat protein